VTVRAVFCWPEISGYMAACWRALARRATIDFTVVGFASAQPGTSAGFADSTLDGVPCRLLTAGERHDEPLFLDLVRRRRPDVIVLPGWMHGPYRRLTRAADLGTSRFVMTMDTPWRGHPRQQLGRLALRPYLRRIDQVVVPGERAWQYARRLGVPAARIRRGLYGVDVAGLHPLLERRRAQPRGWPRRFLFVGRYAADKDPAVLAEAYRRYRTVLGSEAWPLTCCGQGPLESVWSTVDGVTDRGFVQPDAMRQVWQDAGVLVLPSRFDPWPLVLAEACAAGLPVICTDACGSAVELIRPNHNGLVVPVADPQSLSDAMVRMHREHERLPVLGANSQALAAPYSAELWAERWEEWLTAPEPVRPRLPAP
jgi:glycosyltransferase involved in cell wall biosynthesis